MNVSRDAQRLIELICLNTLDEGLDFFGRQGTCICWRFGLLQADHRYLVDICFSLCLKMSRLCFAHSQTLETCAERPPHSAVDGLRHLL